MFHCVLNTSKFNLTHYIHCLAQVLIFAEVSHESFFKVLAKCLISLIFLVTTVDSVVRMR